MNTSSARRALAAVVIGTALCNLPASAQAPVPKAFKATCAKVVAVNDGDTFVCVRSSGKAFPVRVAAIDAPESVVQRAADAARATLVGLAVDGSRTVCSGNLSHKRWVCRVFTPQDEDVGARLLEAGAAWYATGFSDEIPPPYRVLYGKLQSQARSGKTGLWADEDPMPPWQCRADRKLGKPCR